jgi:hypothetical protein
LDDDDRRLTLCPDLYPKLTLHAACEPTGKRGPLSPISTSELGLEVDPDGKASLTGGIRSSTAQHQHRRRP